MLQLFLLGLPGNRVQPTNLLPTGVVITSNNHHRRLLPTESASVLQPEAYSATERSLRSYPINPFCSFCRKGGTASRALRPCRRAGFRQPLYSYSFDSVSTSTGRVRSGAAHPLVTKKA